MGKQFQERSQLLLVSTLQPASPKYPLMGTATRRTHGSKRPRKLVEHDRLEKQTLNYLIHFADIFARIIVLL